MVCGIGEPGCVLAVDPGSIPEGVVRGAHTEVVRAAPGAGVGVQDHLTVPGDVRGHVPIARLATVLPTASDVN